MIPGFVSNYIDKDKYKHLYFFKGIDDNDNDIYSNIDLTSLDCEYELVKHIDGSIDYKFLNKSIIKIICKLVKRDNTIDIIELNFK